MKTIFAFLLFFSLPKASATITAGQLYERLTGVPLSLNDPKFSALEKLLGAGKFVEAAHLVTEEEHFYSVTVRDWASAFSNQTETTLVPFSDFEALVIGVTRDNLDARSLLTGDFRYEADPKKVSLPEPSPKNNVHYEVIESKRLSLRDILIRRTPQWDHFSEAAGLLTTRRWAEEHYRGGTNRRAVRFAFQEFLCAPIAQWKNASLSDFYIRRDIDRKPAGIAMTFQTECRACHAPMDALGGAFANFDFVAGNFVGSPDWIAPKMYQNSDVYPKGHQVSNAGWLNLLHSPGDTSFGWRTSLEGTGVHAFGEMLSHSSAFSHCLTKKVFEKVCRRKTTEADKQTMNQMADLFEKDAYSLRRLFERVAIHPTCF